MDNSITFYTNPQSRSRIVRWMLEELEVPYQVKPIAYGAEMKSPEYRAINPMGKVPAIVHQGQIITECAAICAYLADAFPKAQLAPPLDQRADYYRWLFFAAGPLESAVTNKSLGFEVPAERERMAGYGNYKLTLETLAAAVKKNHFIAGNRFSAADVYVGSHISWGIQFKTMDVLPEFVEYYNRIKERPALQRASALDEQLAKQMGF